MFSTPDVSTTVERAAINRTKVSTSPSVYLNRRVSRGRINTSASSISCDGDVTVLNLLRLQAATACPGGPEGLRNAETQTLVSSRATSGTASRFDLSAGLSDFSLDLFLRYGARSPAHLAHQTVKVAVPLAVPAQGDGHPRIFSQAERLERPKYAFFEDCLKSLVDRSLSLLNGHGEDYIGDLTLRSIPLGATW